MSDSNSPEDRKMRLVCIADRESLRWKAFENAVSEFVMTSSGGIRAEVISWLDLIKADGSLHQIEGFDAKSFACRPALVRIESPARDFEITRALLAAGARETRKPEDQHWSEVKFEKGKLVEPGLAFLGLKRVLTRLSESAAEIEGFNLLANPTDVVSMFDKNETSARLAKSGIATPDCVSIEDLAWTKRYANQSELAQPAVDLIEELRTLGHKTSFAKLAYGSSSSGIVVLNVAPSTSQVIGQSTMALIDGGFYNTKVLGELDAKEVGDRLGYLFRQGITIQRGVEKATIDGNNFDLRVIVINGKVEFTIFRVSRHPITNLHLGGYRGDWHRCRNSIPNRVWLDAMDDCVRACGLYQSHIVGVDLAFDRNYSGHYIIELNPFGDFFPGWENEKGKSIYQVELESMLELVQ